MSNPIEVTEESASRSKILDLEKFLPFGETLRGYLEQSFVRTADLSELLRARGVFVQDATKEDLVPILCATLISPAEFQTLLDCRKERDSKEKVIDRTRSWKSERSLLEAANDAVRLEDLPFESTQKAKLLGRPGIAAVEGNSEHIELEFTVQRTKISLDWSNETSQFKGKVTLKKVEIDGKIVVSITHTSPETKEIAEQYARLIEDSLRASGDIGDPSPDDQIVYSSFDNIGRADFLLSLTGQSDREDFVFLKLSHFDALTDTTHVIPDNCKELIEGFEQLRLKGELHKSAYCRRREIYQFVRFYRMDARYKFRFAGAAGECVVRYEFSDYGVSESERAEFSHEVDVTSLDDKFVHVQKRAVKKMLQELIGRFVEEKFKKRGVAAELSATPVITARTRTRASPSRSLQETGTLFDLNP